MPGFLDMLRAQVPELIRGSIVAAGSPTPGAVGTAQDIFGGFRAAQDDKQQRDMLRIQLQRQAAQDALKQREFEQQQRFEEARIKEYEAQARRYDAQATAPAKTGKDYTGTIVDYQRILGRPLTEREKRTVLGLAQMEADVRKPAVPQKLSGVIAQQMGGLDKESQTYAEDYTNLQKMYQEALEKEQGTKFGESRKPFIRPQLVQTPQGPLWVKAPEIQAGAAAPVADEAGKRVAPKPVQVQTRQFKVTAQDRNQATKEKVATVGNALLLENGGDRSKAAAAAIADPRAKGINKQVQDWLVPPQKGNTPKKSALDEYLERRTGKPNAPTAPSGGGNPYRTAPK